MLELTWIGWLGFSAVSMATSVAAIIWISRSDRRNLASLRRLIQKDADKIAYLFSDGNLVDATPSARNLLTDSQSDSNWQDISALLRPRFPDFPTCENPLTGNGSLTFQSSVTNDLGAIKLEWWDGITRVELIESDSEILDSAGKHRVKLLETELEILRQAMDGAPYPVWQTNEAGTVTWSNAAYLTLQKKLRRPKVDALFDLGSADQVTSGKTRCSLSGSEPDRICWFDVTMARFDTQRMYYAVDVNAVVNAEIAQRNFVQTLAKTFAQISTGLAIFDRNLQLALFNPALVDLTALPADFLSSRPTLLSFFDRLRDNRMMPEPKNYASWREQIADLVTAATDGRYLETWDLPSGPTYRVTGRPHPDGAIAFLIEDISAEVSQTRRFRTELKLGQSLLDAIEDAIVVFSSTGLIALSNAAYRDLWGIDPEKSFVDMTVLDSIRHWQAVCDATPILGEIREYVLECSERTDWEAPVLMKSGTRLICRVHPVAGGATLVRFQKQLGIENLPNLSKTTVTNLA